MEFWEAESHINTDVYLWMFWMSTSFILPELPMYLLTATESTGDSSLKTNKQTKTTHVVSPAF